jgi:hypothetical protein
MSSLIFLAIAVGIFLIGAAIVWFRHRDRTTFTTSIDEFNSKMGALSPDSDVASESDWSRH